MIADGLITGEGETRSTPDIVVSMMDLDPTMTNPKPASYLAIAEGEKQLNMAQVVSAVPNYSARSNPVLTMMNNNSMQAITKVYHVSPSSSVARQRKPLGPNLAIEASGIHRYVVRWSHVSCFFWCSTFPCPLLVDPDDLFSTCALQRPHV